MCFSAPASFTASFLLLIIGIVTMRHVIQKRLYYVAAIPLFFSIQQAAEGVVWLSLLGYTSIAIQHIATYVFLFFAVGIWPFWMPFSLMKAELDVGHKRILKSLAILGPVISYKFLNHLLAIGAGVSIANCHISYDYFLVSTSKLGQYFDFFSYLFIVAAPFFISTVRYMNYFGLSIIISCLLSCYFYYNNFGSVWCFFCRFIKHGNLFYYRSRAAKNRLM